jgi:hypothetical protein
MHWQMRRINVVARAYLRRVRYAYYFGDGVEERPFMAALSRLEISGL